MTIDLENIHSAATMNSRTQSPYRGYTHELGKILLARLKKFNTLKNVEKLEPLRENIFSTECPSTKITEGFVGIYGLNIVLLETLQVISRAATTSLPILIEGESGTGKELMARSVHDKSPRLDQSFITVNCGALPENLVEAELFGHTKGAFTGSTAFRKGKFDAAEGGTIFLDEIGELPLTAQVKLLRVLQNSEIQRIGSDNSVKVNVRVVAATNKNLASLVEAGDFREDLLYRLNMFHVMLPPLRQRRDEIPRLLETFLQESASLLSREQLKLSPTLYDFLCHYDYPGNIRELRNLVYRLACLADSVAELAHLPLTVRPITMSKGFSSGAIVDASASLAEIKKQAANYAERTFLEQKLREVKGKVTELAKILDMNRSHLQTVLKKHNLSSKSFR